MKNNKINKIIPEGYDERVKNSAVRDNGGEYISLESGRDKWNLRKNYGVNFARIFYELGVDEVKEVRNGSEVKFIEKDGKVFVDSPEAKKYFSRSSRMVDCSLKLDFKVNDKGEKKLHSAYNCRDRFCSICMWQLSRRVAWETSQIMDYYMAECSDMVPIMLTLTVKNPKMGELSSMLDVLCGGKSGAWQLLQKWLRRREITDSMRTLELTFNYDEFTWHPHLHVLAFVPKEYFSKGNKNYISHSELAEEWKHVCKLDYTPVVDIRRCYDKNKKNERIKFNSDMKTISFAGAIKETSKYCVKPLELFSNSFDDYDVDDCGGSDGSGVDGNKKNISIKDVVRELVEALSGRRLRSFCGRLKDIAKKLKFNDDDDKKDLLHNEGGEADEASWEEIYEYVFEDKDYYLTGRSEIVDGRGSDIEVKEEILADEDVDIDNCVQGKLELYWEVAREQEEQRTILYEGEQKHEDSCADSRRSREKRVRIAHKNGGSTVKHDFAAMRACNRRKRVYRRYKRKFKNLIKSVLENQELENGELIVFRDVEGFGCFEDINKIEKN